MSSSNSTSDPTERTSLLNKDVKKLNGSSNDGPDGNDEATNGTGTVEDATEETLLFEGNEEMLRKMYILFPAASIGVLLSAADQTLVVTTYGKIGSDLNALNNTSWIATAYFLTLTSFQPLYGKVSDIFGRKPALLFAYAVFGLGCAFCGLARNLEELVAARAFAGIGGGGMTTVVSILMSDIVPLRQRGSWQGYMNIVYAIGASAGAPLGGLFADSIGWRWAFLGQGPICLLAILVVYLVLDLPKPEHLHWKGKLGKVDFLGALSLITAVSILLVGLDRGSNVAWADKITISCCCTSIPLFAIFIFVEMKIASHPFAPGHIIFNRNLLPSYLCNFFTLAAYMSIMFYVPLYFQVVDRLSATEAGTRLIPPLIFSVGGSVFGGQFMQRTGKYYWITVYSLCLSVLCSTLILLSASIINSSWLMILGLCFMSFSGGCVITTTLINVIAHADSKDQAIATACTYLFRSLGSVVGVSLGSTIVQQSLRVLLSKRLSGKEAQRIVDGVRRSLDFIKGLDPKSREVVVECYKIATSASFGMTVGFVSLGLFSACWIKEKKLSK